MLYLIQNSTRALTFSKNIRKRGRKEHSGELLVLFSSFILVYFSRLYSHPTEIIQSHCIKASYDTKIYPTILEVCKNFLVFFLPTLTKICYTYRWILIYWCYSVISVRVGERQSNLPLQTGDLFQSTSFGSWIFLKQCSLESWMSVQQMHSFKKISEGCVWNTARLIRLGSCYWKRMICWILNYLPGGIHFYKVP